MLTLLAVAADARPGHGIQPGFANGAPADLAHPECAVANARQRLLNRSEETSIGLMQLSLQLRFRLGGGLVH